MMMNKSTDEIIFICSCLLKAKLPSIPLWILMNRDDLTFFHTPDNNSIIKQAIINGVGSIVHYYSNLEESQLSKVAALCKNENLLHQLTRNQYFLF